MELSLPDTKPCDKYPIQPAKPYVSITSIYLHILYQNSVDPDQHVHCLKSTQRIHISKITAILDWLQITQHRISDSEMTQSGLKRECVLRSSSDKVYILPI